MTADSSETLAPINQTIRQHNIPKARNFSTERVRNDVCSYIPETPDSIAAGSLSILTQAYISSNHHPHHLTLGKCRALPDQETTASFQTLAQT